ncbi:MAG: hypothetical protein Q8K30_01915 [Candidatus Gracilibacteria bacterium]|nr:hypothetical protein [Candidatus Gracilibacteria bacterium]
MKKIITIIISTIFFFSSMTNTFAKEGYIEKLLDLNYGLEEHNLELAKINEITFSNPEYNKIYNQLIISDRILKDEFIKKYRKGEYTYYQFNGIVSSYKNFIYNTNRFFYYLKIEEQNNNYEEMDKAIKNSFLNMRSSFIKMKNLVKKTY